MQYRTSVRQWNLRLKIVFTGLAITSCLSAFDIVLDHIGIYTTAHMVVEVLAVILLLGLISYLGISMLIDRRLIENLENRVINAETAAEQWAEKSQVLLEDFKSRIFSRFNEWKLTEAESEVGYLILKGISLKAIAAERLTGDKTVRQQAAQIYKKSDLQGRNELAAFFLEELFE